MKRPRREQQRRTTARPRATRRPTQQRSLRADARRRRGARRRTGPSRNRCVLTFASECRATTTVMLSMPPARLAALHEPVSGLLGVGVGLQDRLDLLLGHHAGEAVAAENQAVAVEQADRRLRRRDVRLGADGAGQDVAVGVLPASCCGDLARLDHAVHQRVVVREPAEGAGAEQVGAAVADVRQMRALPSTEVAVRVVPMPGRAGCPATARSNTGRFALRTCSASVPFPAAEQLLDRVECQAATRRPLPVRRPCRRPRRRAAARPDRSLRCPRGRGRCRWRRRPRPSSSELQHGGADPDLVARLHHGGRRELLVVHERAVGRAQVLDVPGAVLAEHAGVLLRGRRCRRSQLALGRSADRHARSPIRTVRGLAPSGGWTTTPMVPAARGPSAASVSCGRSTATRRRFDGEPAHRPAHRAPDEQEQQREQAVLQCGRRTASRLRHEGVARGASLSHRHASGTPGRVEPIVMRSPSASSRALDRLAVQPRAVRRAEVGEDVRTVPVSRICA